MDLNLFYFIITIGIIITLVIDFVVVFYFIIKNFKYNSINIKTIHFLMVIIDLIVIATLVYSLLIK